MHQDGMSQDIPSIIEKLLSTGITQAKIARETGLTQPTISRARTRVTKDVKPNTADSILAYARRKGVSLNEAHDFIIPITGVVLGAAIEPKNELGVAPMVEGATSGTVALVAKDNSMAPLARYNWLVYYNNTNSIPDEKFLGMPHVVALPDGQVLIRDLHHGSRPNTWTLFALNGVAMPDVEILWAEPIRYVAMRPQA